MKEGWAGIHVAPAMEFAACQEAQRLGLTVWFPQRRVRIWPKGVTEPLMRAYPLFKGYLLAPLSQARDRAWHYPRGVRGPKYLVEDPKGRPWTAPDEAVRELCQLERENAFDDPLPGNAVRLTGCDLLAAIAGEALTEVFAPLFRSAPENCPKPPSKAELLAPVQIQAPAWVDHSKVSAATSRDVLAAIENGRDDRSFAQRSADASAAQAVARAANPIKWKYRLGSLASAQATERV
jgi:hypothetical protein